MATLILLIRHGTTPTTGQVLPGRAPGLHLSEKGGRQAQEVAQRLAGLPLDAVYTSPMERARETAGPTDPRPRVLGDLIECDFGEWTGRRLSELATLPEWRQVQREPSQFRFPGGESFMEMQERMLRGIRGAAAAHPGGVVALFSHADPIKAAVAEFLGLALDDFQRIRIDTASVSVLEFAAEERVVVHNSRTGSLSYLREP